MKVLIIGYGSIGSRHESVLEKFENITKIDIVTKQNLENKITFESLENVDNIDYYDYFIISSITKKHYEQLEFIESKVSNKIIFCEKPLFEIKKELTIKKNELFIGYVLRFHPLLQKLKSELKHEKVLSVNVNCGKYLPSWRPNVDYRNSYSAKKSDGGGALLDLSHEIDYVQWLFGKLVDIKSYQLKVSNLEIDSDDITTFIGKTENNVLINLSVDYLSKILCRRMLIHTLNNSYELDFIANKLIKKNSDDTEKVFLLNDLERDHMFENMHKAILLKNNNACSYKEGLEIMETINTIQEQNK